MISTGTFSSNSQIVHGQQRMACNVSVKPIEWCSCTLESSFSESPDDKCVLVQPFDWTCASTDQDGPFPSKGDLTIRCWGKDTDNRVVLLKITDYPVTFYVDMQGARNVEHPSPSSGSRKRKNPTPTTIRWNRDALDMFENTLSRTLGQDQPTAIQFVKRKYLYCCNVEPQRNMARLQFRNEKAGQHCVNILKRGLKFGYIGTLAFTCHEDKISTITKFMSQQDVSPTQWIRIQTPTLEEGPSKVSTAFSEYRATYTYVKGVNCTCTPMEGGVRPIRDLVQPCRLVAFDIETYSSRYMMFPDPTIPEDECFIISVVLQNGEDKDTRKKWCLTRGNPDIWTLDCNFELILCTDEVDLISRFCSLINQLDPDVLTGHNVWGFDMKYLYVRSNLIHGTCLPNLSRLVDNVETKLSNADPGWSEGKDGKGKECDITAALTGIAPSDSCREGQSTSTTKKQKKSSYSRKLIHVFEMEGRISLDVYHAAESQYKLPKYTLEFLSQHFLNYGKKDVTPTQLFAAFRDCVLKERTSVPAVDSPPPAPVCSKEEDEEESSALLANAVNYCVVDSDLVVDLFVHIKVWLTCMEFAKTFGVTPFETLSRGQQVRCMSSIYRLASSRGLILNSKASAAESTEEHHYGSNHSYKGGAVVDPVKGIHDFVICVSTFHRCTQALYRSTTSATPHLFHQASGRIIQMTGST